MMPGDDNTLPVPSDAAAEIAQLEMEMADQHSSYWKGLDAETSQTRYRDLITARDGGDTEDGDEEGEGTSTPAEVRQTYGAAMDGLDDHTIAVLQDNVTGALSLMPDAADFAAAFDAADMTDRMRRSFFRIMALPVMAEEERMEPDVLLDKRIGQLREGLSAADIASGQQWLSRVPQQEVDLMLEFLITPFDERGSIGR